MKKRTRLIWLIIALLVAAIVSWFKLLPAFNIKDGRFLGWVVSVTAGIVLIMISTAGNWWFGSYNTFFESVEAVWKSKNKVLRRFFRVEVGLLGIFGVLSLYKIILPYTGSFWACLSGATILIVGVPLVAYLRKRHRKRMRRRTTMDGESQNPKSKKGKIFGYIVAILITLIAASFIGYICGAQVFRAKEYYNLLRMNAEEGTIDDIPSSLDSIAIMDTESAKALGDTEIGSISAKSQFEVSDNYVQLNVNGKPLKVAPLRYADFIKWMMNYNSGIPGYIEVDPAVDNGNSEYIPFDEKEGGMIYDNSAALWQNIELRLRLAHPTMMFLTPHLECDDEGGKWLIAPVYDYKIGLFGGQDMVGAIIVNPFKDKWSENYYRLDEIPDWVDYVFDGNLLCDQYNFYGKYAKGFLNGNFGQVGCTKVTEDDGAGIDYGYLTTGADISIYTGIKSMTASSSDHGFLLANERTGEATYIEYASVDEFSAMTSAAQDASEKQYTPCFPSLTRQQVNNREYVVYFGALKDARGFIKRYYVVDATQGSIASVGDSRKKALENFANKVGGFPTMESEEEIDLSSYHKIKVTIDRIVFTSDGVVYLVTDDYKRYYTSKFRADYVLLKEGGDYVILTDDVHFYYEAK